MRVPAALILALALAACQKDGDADGDTDVVVDSETPADTDVVDTDVGDTDVVVADCPLADDLGTRNDLTWEVLTDFGPSSRTVYALLDADGVPDVIQLELYGDTSTFPGNPTPGTFTIEGADAQYATCGVCVLLFVDVDESGVGASYFATAGTVTLTETDRGVVGTLSDLVLDEVTIDPETFESTLVGTCATALTEAAVELWVEETDCSNSEDEDRDTLVDCDDPDCAGASACIL